MMLRRVYISKKNWSHTEGGAADLYHIHFRISEVYIIV